MKLTNFENFTAELLSRVRHYWDLKNDSASKSDQKFVVNPRTVDSFLKGCCLYLAFCVSGLTGDQWLILEFQNK